MKCFFKTSWLVVLACLVVFLCAGCGTKTVVLKANQETLQMFKKVDINPDDYAFFTTGPSDAPEAILLIGSDYLGEYDSSGWKLRDKQTVMKMLKTIASRSTEGKQFGYPVTDGTGVVKGKMFTAFRHGKVFVYEEEGTFVVATPSMMDTGKGSYKRTSCSISVCQ